MTEPDYEKKLVMNYPEWLIYEKDGVWYLDAD